MWEFSAQGQYQASEKVGQEMIVFCGVRRILWLYVLRTRDRSSGNFDAGPKYSSGKFQGNSWVEFESIQRTQPGCFQRLGRSPTALHPGKGQGVDQEVRNGFPSLRLGRTTGIEARTVIGTARIRACRSQTWNGGFLGPSLMAWGHGSSKCSARSLDAA